MPEASTAAVTTEAASWTYALGLSPGNNLVRVRKEDMLPIASNTVRGGVRVGAGLAISADVLSLGAHSHGQAEITGLVDALAAKADGAATTAALAGKAATVHTHAISGVTGLQAALDAKADGAATTTALATKADAAATTAALAGKAATGLVTGSGLTMSTQKLLGRGAASTGAVAEVAIGNGLSLSAGASPTLSAGGLTTLNKGTGAAASTQTFDVSAAGHQRLQVGGALSVAFTNWPAGFGELLIELVNGGLHIVTWPTIKWLRPDGSYTTVFASTGVVLNPADTDWILIWSGNGGTNLFGKVMR